MRRSVLILATAALASLGPVGAQAQMFGHHKPPPAGQSGGQQIDCDMVAANPNSGMDKATCEQMNQAASAYYGARDDPAGVRPGDETMSCADIKAEFMNQPIQAPSAQHAAEGQAAATDYQAKSKVIQSEAAALEAKESAENMAASAASTANPMAGRAADQALQASQQAEQAALNAHAQATMDPAARRLTSSTGAIVGDMTPQLQSNPRIAHLVQLANEKHCHGF